MADTLSVTVVVCAYSLDRWKDLTAAIRSIIGQDRRVQQCVLVIDHNRQLLDRAARSFLL